MSKSEMLTAVGLMSGTSLDGVDAAILRTDGERVELTECFYHEPYSGNFRKKLKHALKEKKVDASLEHELTEIHASAVNKLLKIFNINNSNIDIIGFHGQTIDHRPDDVFTWQIGDGELLAKLTQIDVVSDFRSADVKAGGQGAPLVPLFHKALVGNNLNPVAILNLGGVGNVTYIHEDELIAFDTGPANALIDDVVFEVIGQKYDDQGKIAKQGRVDAGLVKLWLGDAYFIKPPPKSLDRDHFVQNIRILSDMAFEDKVATLTSFTAQTVAKSIELMPTKPQTWYVTGGGVHNATLLGMLESELSLPVGCISKLGVNPDATEALAFAFLAVRSLYNMPLSLPSTTGILDSDISGGVLARA